MKLKQITTLLFFGFFFSCANHVIKKQSSSLPYQEKILKVSNLFSNNAVLQRDTLVNIWGKAHPNERIKVLSEWGQELIVKSKPDGFWSGQLQTPNAGGPFSIEIYSENEKLKIKNILIGEVWIASGQSNMEMTFKGYPPNDQILNSTNEISNANYPNIRMFHVKKTFSIEPSNKLNGSWIDVSPEHVENFSATAYFFAREIHRNINVPVGIIHSSWGGSPAESWTSDSKLKELELFSETLKNINKSKPDDIIKRWFDKFDSIDVPFQKDSEDMLEDEFKKIAFADDNLCEFQLNDNMWKNAILPGRFDSLISMEFDGAVWFRKEVIIDNVESDYYLSIGYIDDMDKTFFNGKIIGDHSGYGFWNKKRQYVIPKSYIKKGKNIIAIRAIDMMGPGSFGGSMNLSNDFGEHISIEGNWKYRPIAELYEGKFYIYDLEYSNLNKPFFIKLNPFLPKVLFNGMINPLIPFTIKGAIWYQGESNVGRHEQYTYLFPGMIEDWRDRWGKEFPFYYVQIAPFNYAKSFKKNISQELREAQRHALKLPKTGMVVTLDIGDFDNIHPANKQDVGKRLARLALVNDYGFKLTPLGPILKKSEVINNSIKLEFDHIGSGLVYLKDEINQFEIANSNMEYFKANVSIEKNHIFVSSDFVSNPKYVRYAWSDMPNATLFNTEGFPSSSFMIEIK